jgi:hypothetical protein
MLHQVQSSFRHKCCAHVMRSCANMYCLPFCAHYHETRTRRALHVCAHRSLQRVPLNTRYSFKQSSMFNGVGINCFAVCTCRCVHRTIKRSCEARYTKPAALEASAGHKCCIKFKAIVGTPIAGENATGGDPILHVPFFPFYMSFFLSPSFYMSPFFPFNMSPHFFYK